MHLAVTETSDTGQTVCNVRVCLCMYCHDLGVTKDGFVNGHLYTQLGTTSNYSATADFHNLQTTSTR
jgi:hypothetical protein